MYKKNNLEDRLFSIILIVSFILSFISIVGNILLHFPFYVNLKWMIFIILILYTFFKSQITYKIKEKFIFFFFVIFIMIPYGWFDSGGNQNNTIAYFFLILICISFLFYGKSRIFLIISLVSIFITLQFLGHYFPNLVKIYDEQNQFMDRIIQIPITLITSFLLLNQFSNEYRKEKTELKKANEKLKFYAQKDSLTALYNRRIYDEKLKEILNKKLSEKVTIFSILLDIDNFKKINDNFGHDTGDLAIKLVANELEKIFNKSFVTRWGGDEFAILYFDETNSLLEKINLLQKNIKNKSKKLNTKITLSIGITKIKTTDNEKTLLKRTDKALYLSKENGKDQYNIL
ncbi:hypothetical protein OSSY52_09410 [Tepiditoga spiralis]|uniref:GGDEF domain-containing protein n=1 Tax=Tepiditoga spiralis TaxID=2108365 RepID=A0A7G1G343_9BACT|nr:GGDEF domain-containing protein [Tepiditoga spiralis]BBE30800.1 hypothetical protein OSSY52_09410 [Tepiditoga spiralis]